AVSVPSLSAGSLHGIGIDATMTVTPDALSIARADANWSGANAAIAGRIELVGQKRLDLAITAHAADLQKLLTEAGAQSTAITGAVVAQGEVRGTLKRPVANGTVTVTDVVACGERFGSIDAVASLVGSDLTLSRFTVDKPQPDEAGSISATGSYNFDRENYTLDLRSKNLRLLGLMLPS